MSERPGPGEPAYWPEADAVGGHWIQLPGGLEGAWVVLGLPPEPFLGSGGITADRLWPRAVYGPPGTIWEFRLADVVERLFHVDPRGGATLLKFVLRKLGRVGPTGVPLFWVIPNTYAAPGGPMRYISSTIIGKLDQDESVAHTLKWRTAVENAPMDGAAIQDFANLLRDRWVAFLNAPGAPGSGTSMRTYFPPDLTYTEVRAAYVEQTMNDQVKPPYLVPTHYAPILPPQGNCAGTSALPYEVACCLSLNTNFRGPRFRGRLYLGPLTVNWMESQGHFSHGYPDAAGAAFWNAVVTPIEAEGYELHVISKKWTTSARVIGVRTGTVPDAMRSRRRSQSEEYHQSGGAPLGSLPA